MRIVGIGIDIVETSRIRSAIDRFGERFLQRIFTDGERQYCGLQKASPSSYAVRFAAKEAVSKAFGTGIGAGFGWLDIEVQRKPRGEPFVVLHGGAADLAQREGITEVMLSLSHSEHYAVAQVVAVGE